MLFDHAGETASRRVPDLRQARRMDTSERLAPVLLEAVQDNRPWGVGYRALPRTGVGGSGPAGKRADG